MCSASVGDLARLMDPVEPPRSLIDLANIHRWPTGSRPTTFSLRSIVDRHRNAQSVTRRLLFYNTFLAPGLELRIKDFVINRVLQGVPILGGVLESGVQTLVSALPDGPLRLGAKPALKARAREIGRSIANGYDIAALCELFSEEERRLISAYLARDGKPHIARGPDDSGGFVVATSGLFTVSIDLISRTQRHVFTERGNRCRDFGAWANKGVLLAEVDLGLPRGKLEVYSTHLLAGGRISSHEERLRIQLKQVDELVAFVTRAHHSENVSIIVGDFNINAHEASEFTIDGVPGTPFSLLSRKLAAIDMQDIWALRNGTLGLTANLQADSGICIPDRTDQRYCDDSAEHQASGARIDYVFVERQKPTHAFLADFARPRRVRFERPANAPDRSKIPFMSDHLGLDITIFATPI
jgi:endonuclease/exonuclease/phosphatase family metal-dependent hydrolase